jgi:hypothetical protein
MKPAMTIQRVATFAIAVHLVFAFGQNARAVIMNSGAATDPAWQQEYKDLGCQYDCVVALYGYNGTSWQNIGSGTVISDHCVIGAAHSALFNNGQLFQKYGMVTGNNLVSDWWGHYETLTVDVHPGFTSFGVSTDLAIWTFDQPIADVTPATLYTGSDTAEVGSLVDLAGFGISGYDVTDWPYSDCPLDGAKRGCQNLLTTVGATSVAGMVTADDGLMFHYAFPGQTGYQHLGGVGASGDSGGGHFIDGTTTLFGVHGWGGYAKTDHYDFFGEYLYSDYDCYFGGTSVSKNVDWINSIVVPEPSTIVMLVIAAAAFLLCRRRRA